MVETSDVSRNFSPEPKMDREPDLSQYKLYPFRYVMLVILSLHIFLNGVYWISLSSITPHLVKYFGKPEGSINWVVNMFYVVPSCLAIPAIFLQRALGTKGCIYAGAFMHAAGSVIKLIAFALPDLDLGYRYYIVLGGAVIHSLGQVFVFNLTCILSADWFSPSQREITTSIPYSAGMLGVCYGFIFSFVIMNKEYYVLNQREGLTLIMSLELAFAIIAFIISMFAKERPPTPPSKSQEKFIAEEEASKEGKNKVLLKQIVGCFKDWRILIMLVVFSLYFFIPGVVSTFLTEMNEYYIDDPVKLSGYMGAASMVAGAVVNPIIGTIVSKGGHKSVIPVSLSIQIFNFIALSAILGLNLSHRNTNVIMFVVFTLYGCMNRCFIPLCLEILAGTTYPFNQLIYLNLSFLLGNGVAGASIGFLSTLSKEIKYTSALSLGIAALVFNFFTLSFVKIENRRMKQESELEVHAL